MCICIIFIIGEEVVVAGEGSMGCGLDAMIPSSKEDFDEFGKLLVKKMSVFVASQHFPGFVEDVVRNVCVNCKSPYNYLCSVPPYIGNTSSDVFSLQCHLLT